MKNILLAVALQRYIDFTPHALAARQVATELALFHRARIHALTVEGRVRQPPRTLDADLESTEEKLRRFVEPIREAGVEVLPRLIEGAPRRLIAEQAREVGADLIVMGSHSRRTILDVTLGGTAAAVLASAPCRVILAAAPAGEHARVRDLVSPDRLLSFE